MDSVMLALLNKKVKSVASGISNIQPTTNGLIFTTNTGTNITVTLPTHTHSNLPNILEKFTLDVNNKLLFDGQPISGTVDLSNYALKNGNVNEDFSANNLTVQGDMLPTTNGIQNIGSPTNRFGTIYVNEAKLSTNTLYLGDTPVMGTNQDTIVIKGDKDQSIAIKTTGVGTSKIISENGVELSTSGMNANVNVQATGSGANTNLGATNQVNLIAPNINIQGTSTDVKGAMAVDSLTIRGDITINGGATTIQSTTVQVEDNIIELNKGEVGYGVTAGRSGLKIDRGDADDYLIIFDETDDSLKIGTDSILQKVATQNYVDTQDNLKVDKVVGKSLILDTEITRLASITNVKPTNYLYVGKNGNDITGDGSANLPFLTIQKAIDTATSGTVIFIFPSTYIENITFKAGVMLTSPVKFGVTIIGNHIVDFTGTVVCENITFNSATGNTISFQGTGTQNFQILGCSVNSTSGDAINWTNTNVSSKIYFEDGTCNVSTSGTSARCFYSSSTSKGSLIANRVSFKVNNPDNVCLSMNGSVSFTHTSDQVIGQAIINNSATYTSATVSHTTNTVPSVITNSSGLTTMLNCIQIGTSIPMVDGAGLFAECAIIYPYTGKGTASTLNGGLGANILNMASIKLRSGTLKPTVQDGLFEYDGTDLYFTKNNVRSKVVFGENNEHEIVSVLPTSNINQNVIYLLSTDKSINIYNGTSWDKYGGTGGSVDMNTLPTF